MQLCPLCNAEYPDHIRHCVHDGEKLVAVIRDENDLSGTVFNRRYRLEEKIGAGGMGAVYRGTQEPVGRPVAVKVLQRDLAGDKVAVRRFFNEARVVSKLRHPNTITLYDFGQSDTGHLFIAMEYLTGVSLNQFAHDADLSLADVLEIADQVCQALEEAHGIGIVHRDLKPDNIFIDRVGSRNLVKVLDFGIAKIPDSQDHLTRTGMVFGTPTYMSPEQAQGFELDHKSDLYTLGILLYELLSGEPPFTGDSPMQVALKHVTTKPAPIVDMSHYRPLPLGLSAIVMDLLEKDPDHRPASIGEVRRRLTKLARELPGLAIEMGREQKEVVRVAAPQGTIHAAWAGAEGGGAQVAVEHAHTLLSTPALDLPPPSDKKRHALEALGAEGQMASIRGIHNTDEGILQSVQRVLNARSEPRDTVLMEATELAEPAVPNPWRVRPRVLAICAALALLAALVALAAVLIDFSRRPGDATELAGINSAPNETITPPPLVPPGRQQPHDEGAPLDLSPSVAVASHEVDRATTLSQASVVAWHTSAHLTDQARDILTHLPVSALPALATEVANDDPSTTTDDDREQRERDRERRRRERESADDDDAQGQTDPSVEGHEDANEDDASGEDTTETTSQQAEDPTQERTGLMSPIIIQNP